MYTKLKDYPHQEHLTHWDEVTQEQVSRLENAIEQARNEEDIQRFLQTHPHLLIQHLGGGHGRWVIPKLRLGSEYVTDFVIGEKDSSGFWWTLVELESPKVRLFNRNGGPSSSLNHAIRQIQDWRIWLQSNRNYAANPPENGGHDLRDIRADAPGLILLGRRSDVTSDTNSRRRQMMIDLNIKIHSFDWLIDQSQGWLRGGAPSSLREQI